MKKYCSEYSIEENLIITTLSGNINNDDVEVWSKALEGLIAGLPDGTKFKMMVNLYGFKATDFSTHKQFRAVVPSLLASVGWYVGYLRMFPDSNVTIRSCRGVQCLAAVHVHHDEVKIENYATNYSMKNEAFMTDPGKALEWIKAISIS